jgi:hypothetical protein
MRHTLSTLVAFPLVVGLLAPVVSSAQAPRGRQPARTATTAQLWQCDPRDSVRAFRRAVRLDSLRAAQRGGQPPAGTTPVTGGTQRSQEFPEYDVVLDVPNLCVNRIFLKVDSVTATINLNARVANLVRVNAGAEVVIGRVDLTIEGVRAQALLLVDLDDVYYIVDNTLTFIDNHPEVVRQLGSTLQTTVGAVGGLVGGLVRGLLLGTTRLASGETVQRLVDEATGALFERTLSAAGRVVAERAVGSVLNLPTLRETTNAAGQLVRQVRDQAGALIEYTLDRATNQVRGVRVLQRAGGG